VQAGWASLWRTRRQAGAENESGRSKLHYYEVTTDTRFQGQAAKSLRWLRVPFGSRKANGGKVIFKARLRREGSGRHERTRLIATGNARKERLRQMYELKKKHFTLKTVCRQPKGSAYYTPRAWERKQAARSSRSTQARGRKNFCMRA